MFNSRVLSLIAVALCYCFLICTKTAKASPFEGAKYSIKASSIIKNNNHNEIDNETVINQEKGTTLGYKVSLNMETNDWRYSFSSQYSKGTLAYKGLTSLNQARHTTTDLRQGLYELSVNYNLIGVLNDYCVGCDRFDIGAGFEYSSVARNIESQGAVLGLKENYRYLAIKPHIQIYYPLSENTDYILGLNYTQSLWHKLTIDFSNLTIGQYIIKIHFKTGEIMERKVIKNVR